MNGFDTRAIVLGWRRMAALVAAICALVVRADPALAHHVMGGRLPATWAEGLLSGFGHPVIGLDHLAAIIAVGLLAAALRRGFLMPLAFVAASALGAALHVKAIDMPADEAAVAVSVVVFGALLLRGRSLAGPALATLFAVAGLFHGYAYGESIVGAEPTPLVAYFIGFSVVQYGFALGALLVARRLAARTEEGRRRSAVVPGGAIAAVGLVFLALAVIHV